MWVEPVLHNAVVSRVASQGMRIFVQDPEQCYTFRTKTLAKRQLQDRASGILRDSLTFTKSHVMNSPY